MVVQLLLRQVDNHLAVILQGVLLGVGLLELAEHGARVHLVAIGHGDRVFHGGGVVGALGEDSPGGAFVAVAVVGQVEAVVALALHQGEVKLRVGNLQPAVNVRVLRLKGGKIDRADVGLFRFRLGADRLQRFRRRGAGRGFHGGTGRGLCGHRGGIPLQQQRAAHHAQHPQHGDENGQTAFLHGRLTDFSRARARR